MLFEKYLYDEDTEERVKDMERRTLDELGAYDTLHAVLDEIPFREREDIFEEIIAKYDI